GAAVSAIRSPPPHNGRLPVELDQRARILASTDADGPQPAARDRGDAGDAAVAASRAWARRDQPVRADAVLDPCLVAAARVGVPATAPAPSVRAPPRS